jgi:putative SOS response-associated peptidase YedK
VETVDTAPSYREAFKKRRCLIPADSFYEWKKVLGGKIPFSIGMKDDAPFVFAGLWEGWKDPATNEWLRTCTIITGEPNEFVREIHTRMPVILLEEQHDAWLSGEAVKEVLVPYPANRMKAWPIDARVNSPENNDPEIIVPIEQHEKISQIVSQVSAYLAAKNRQTTDRLASSLTQRRTPICSLWKPE